MCGRLTSTRTSVWWNINPSFLFFSFCPRRQRRRDKWRTLQYFSFFFFFARQPSLFISSLSLSLSRLSTDVMIRNSLSLLKENRGNFLNRSRIPFLPSSRPHCQEEERAWRYYKWRSGRCVTECDWGFGRQLVPSSKWNPVIQSKHRCRTSERA